MTHKITRMDVEISEPGDKVHTEDRFEVTFDDDGDAYKVTLNTHNGPATVYADTIEKIADWLRLYGHAKPENLMPGLTKSETE